MEDMDLRALYDGNFYHVCTNGLEQVTLLKDEEDFRTAWNYLEILACKDASDANTAIKLFKQQISKYLRNKYGVSQVLHNTEDCISVIDTVQYMKNCIAYILRNAVCARICARPEDYRWASYACQI